MSFAPLTAGSHVGLFMLTSCVSLYQGILLLCCPLLWWVLMLLCRVFEKIRLLVGSWTTFSHSNVPSCCRCWMGSVSSSTSVQARQQWWNTVLSWFPMPGQLDKLRTVFILTNYGLLTYKLILCWPKVSLRKAQVLGLRPSLWYQNQMALVVYASISDGLMLSQCPTRFQCPALMFY